MKQMNLITRCALAATIIQLGAPLQFNLFARAGIGIGGVRGAGPRGTSPSIPARSPISTSVLRGTPGINSLSTALRMGATIAILRPSQSSSRGGTINVTDSSGVTRGTLNFRSSTTAVVYNKEGSFAANLRTENGRVYFYDLQSTAPSVYGEFGGDGKLNFYRINESGTYNLEEDDMIIDENRGAVTKELWTNSLGMIFAQVPNVKGAICIWETRNQDYATFTKASPRVNNSWQNSNNIHGLPISIATNHPVVNVSWEDAIEFCTWLTQKERLEGLLDSSHKYRLPKYAEWRHAIGLENRYPWGNQWPPPAGAGNYGTLEGSLNKSYSDSYETTAPVGSFNPNQFGLYDLGGNVSEWGEDIPFGKFLSICKYRDTHGTSFIKTFGPGLHSECKGYDSEWNRRSYLGFRILLDGKFLKKESHSLPKAVSQ